MSIDPLEFFYQLEEKKKPKETDKTYPGSTPPRNNDSNVDTDEVDWLSSLPSQEFLVRGVKTKFYTIGALAQALGKSQVTIRSWERKGWIPPASFRTPPPRGPQLPDKESKGRRLYSQDQLVFLVTAHERYVLNPKAPNWKGFRQHIKTQYPR